MACGRNSPQQHSNVIPIDSGSHRAKVLARRDELAQNPGNLAMVDRIARGIHATLPPSFDLDDLVSTGRFWLLRAATRYRPREHNQTPFACYAWPVVHRGIVRSIAGKQYTENTRLPMEHEESSLPDFDASIDSERISRSVALAVDLLPDRERRLMKRYYGTAEPSLETVSIALGFSLRTAMRVHASAIGTLRGLLTA